MTTAESQLQFPWVRVICYHRNPVQDQTAPVLHVAKTYHGKAYQCGAGKLYYPFFKYRKRQAVKRKFHFHKFNERTSELTSLKGQNHSFSDVTNERRSVSAILRARRARNDD